MIDSGLKSPFERQEPKAQASQPSVDDKHLVAELVGQVALGQLVEREAKQGRDYANKGYVAVARLAFGEKAEREQAQQWPVSIGSDHVNRVDHASVIDCLED